MLKDITLGQYFPGSTVIHRLDPRVKIVLALSYIIVLFLAAGIISYFLMFIWLALIIALSGIKLKVILKSVKPLIFIIILTALFNIFYTPGQNIFSVNIFGKNIIATAEGCAAAAFMICRMIMLITGTFMLTYTTSPIMLTDGIESLLNPLKKIKMPVHELAMMMSIALRFIPTLIEETDRIMSAQRARGADFDTGNIIKRARALMPIIVPLFISAFRRAEELADAMECRCYQGGEGRTKMRQLKMKNIDAYALAFCAILFAAVITLGAFKL